MTKPVRFAVIGCGMLAQGVHIPTIANSKKALLHILCDLDEKALAMLKAKYNPKKITTDFASAINDSEVDAICLATTESLRIPPIELAAKLGKPVYVEKPLAKTLDQMYQIRDIVKKSGIPFCVGHNRRSSPAMIEAHRIFRSHMTNPNPKPCPWRWDRLGKDRPRLAEDGVAGMSIRINDDWYSWKGWAFDTKTASATPLIFELTHFTDLANWFLAAEPEEVVALEGGMLNHGLVVKYKTGEIATFSLSANGTFGYPKELYECFGNGAAVVIDHMLEVRTAGIEGVEPRITFPIVRDRHPEVGQELGLHGWLAKTRANAEEAVEKGNTELIMGGGPDKGHSRAMELFVDEINGLRGSVCGIDEAIMATRVAFAAVKSSHERRFVKLSEV